MSVQDRIEAAEETVASIDRQMRGLSLWSNEREPLQAQRDRARRQIKMLTEDKRSAPPQQQ